MTVLLGFRDPRAPNVAILGADGLETKWDCQNCRWIRSQDRAKKIRKVGSGCYLALAGISDYVDVAWTAFAGVAADDLANALREFVLQPSSTPGAEFGLVVLALSIHGVTPVLSQWRYPRQIGGADEQVFAAYLLPKGLDGAEAQKAVEKCFYNRTLGLKERITKTIELCHSLSPETVGRNAYAVSVRNGVVEEGWLSDT